MQLSRGGVGGPGLHQHPPEGQKPESCWWYELFLGELFPHITSLLQINLSWNLTLKQTFWVLAKTKRYKHRLGFMQNINKDSENVLLKLKFIYRSLALSLSLSLSLALFLEFRKVPFFHTISLSPCYSLI